jgi:hypothetical protein
MNRLLNIGILSRRSEGKEASRCAVAAGRRRRYGSRVPPSLGAALRLGLSALRRAGWLVAPGFLVALLRRALVWPAPIVGWALVARGAVHGARSNPLDPGGAALAGAAAVIGSPGFLALVLGLAFAGIVAGAALRVAFVAGALPTLAGAAAGDPGTPRFAAGVAFNLPRVLGTAVLGLAAESSAFGFGLALVISSVRISAGAAAGRAAPLLAAALAGALVLALLVPVALQSVADAAVARSGVLAEGPARAFAGAVRRFLARPGTFVLASLLFGFVASVVPSSIEGVGSSAIVSAAGRVPALVVAGPQLMLAVFATIAAAGIDLVWLGTVAALGCADERG